MIELPLSVNDLNTLQARIDKARQFVATQRTYADHFQRIMDPATAEDFDEATAEFFETIVTAVERLLGPGDRLQAGDALAKAVVLLLHTACELSTTYLASPNSGRLLFAAIFRDVLRGELAAIDALDEHVAESREMARKAGAN